MSIVAANCGLTGNSPLKGYAISIIGHLLVIAIILTSAANIKKTPELMVIDFSILEHVVEEKPVMPVKQPEVIPPKEVKPVPQIAKPPEPKPVEVKKIVKKPVKIIPIKKEKIAKVKPKEIPVEEVKPEPVVEEKIVSEPEIIRPKEVPPPLSQPAVVTTKPVKKVQLAAPSAGISPAEKKQSDLNRYTKAHFNHIRQGIQQKINYPRTARRMGWEGKVVVEFVVCKDGTVKEVQIVESSGFSALDNNAVSTIKNAAPFPVPPIPAKLIIPVVYRLNS